MQLLVFDLGMNNGDDTEYYLAKGYNVVAVEANPHLCKFAEGRFSKALATGKLAILNLAIAEFAGDCTFYVNTNNHHWSSLDINWAARNDTGTTPYNVRGTTIPLLIEMHGCPNFMKIDIEGGDMIVLRQLLNIKPVPQFLSIEDCRFGFEYIDLLYRIGYRRFKLSNQALVPLQKDPGISHQFQLGSSGMFGDDLPGEWFDYASFLRLYEQAVRSRENLVRKASPEVWWDIHCGL